MRHRKITLMLALIAGLFAHPTASAQSGISVTDNQADLDFPAQIDFSIALHSDAEITEIVLEYGVEQLTCGTVVSKAFPEFTPSPDVEAEWTWEMLQTGSEPPGAQIWWRWYAADASGDELLTDQQTITWLDDHHHWQTISEGSINLHWYSGSQSFGYELHGAATDALLRLEQATGLVPDNPVDLYIYASPSELRDAVFYEPGWTGGLAYASNNIVVIGISPSDIEWGKRTEAHELTHILVGRFTFSCLVSIPTWLNEGLAMYGEGGLTPEEAGQLEEAIAENTLLSARALTGSFSENPEVASLSYSQSYSLVNFLITEYDQQHMFDLLIALRDGAPIDQALETIYGFDVDGLEDAWRESVGAQPRVAGGATPTPTPIPTVVPTFAPVSGIPLAAEPATTPSPAEHPTATPIDPDGSPPGATAGWVVPVCGALACGAGVILLVLIVLIARQR